jgi:hypothetical protein
MAEPIPNLTGVIILLRTPPLPESTIPALNFTTLAPVSANLSAASSQSLQVSPRKSEAGGSASINIFSDVLVPIIACT